MKHIVPLIIASMSSLGTTNGNEQLPLGATDLAPNEHLEKYKEKKVETESIEWNRGKDLEYEAPIEDANRTLIIQLFDENYMLKNRISELERRIEKIEKLQSSTDKIGANQVEHSTR